MDKMSNHNILEYDAYIKLHPVLPVIWLSCTAALLLGTLSEFLLFPLLIGTISSLIYPLFPRPYLSVLSYVLLFSPPVLSLIADDFFIPEAKFCLLFLPFLLYFQVRSGITFAQIASIVAADILLYMFQADLKLIFLFTALNPLGIFFAIIITENNELKMKYRNFYYSARQEKYRLKKLNESIIAEQNGAIENAILNERNRMARDIHDSLGHLTSRGILQIGAMMVTEKNPDKREQLSLLKTTLSEGLAEVRASLHNFQNETIGLKSELEKMTENFTKCTVHFTYSVIQDFSLKVKYSIIYIVKEALTNISKHSNATEAEVSIVETSDNIYIKIFDNGKNAKLSEDGMGLHSIKSRAEDMNGRLEISTGNGFRIFITLKKKEGKL